MQPAVKPFDVSSILVLEPKRVLAGMQSVWAGEDSAHRAVAPPGDSAAHRGGIIIPRDTVPETPADSADAADWRGGAGHCRRGRGRGQP